MFLKVAVAGILLLAGTYAYVVVRWRRAPAAFRAMNYVTLISLVAGLTIGFSLSRVLFLPIPHEEERGVSVPDEDGSDDSMVRGNTGIPKDEVAGELEQQDIKHIGDKTWARWADVEQDCRLRLADSNSLHCKAAHLATELLAGLRVPGSKPQVIPYSEVIQFCDAGYADKASKVCIAAYRFGGKSDSR